MGEVIPNGDPRDRTPQLHAAPDALEAREGFDGACRIDAGSPRRGDRRESILEVVLAVKGQAQQSNEIALIEYFEAARGDHACTPAIAHAETLHSAPAAASKDAVNRWVGPVDYQSAGPRYRSDEVVKLSLNRRKIGEDVSMIKLYIVQNGEPGPVMHHLGTLVKKGGIV